MRILASPNPRMLLHRKDCIHHWKEEEGKGNALESSPEDPTGHIGQPPGNTSPPHLPAHNLEEFWEES